MVQICRFKNSYTEERKNPVGKGEPAVGRLFVLCQQKLEGRRNTAAHIGEI